MKQPMFLSRKKALKIHEAAIKVLETTGIKLDHPRAEELYLKAGAIKDGKGRILITRKMVEDALSQTKPAFKLYNRDGTKFIEIKDGKTFFGTGSDALYNVNPETGKINKTVLADIERNVRIADKLSGFDFVMSMGLPYDVDQEKLYPTIFAAMVQNTTKPLVVTATTPEDIQRTHDIASIVAGSKEKLRQKPFFIAYLEPVSPLIINKSIADRILYCAEHNIPILFAAGANLGSGAPTTPELGVVQGNAEFLAGLVLAKLKNPDVSVVYGANTSLMDMKTSIVCYGAPEWTKTVAMYADMGKYYNLPSWGTAGCSDSFCMDVQAAWEAQESILFALMSGTTMAHDVAFLAHGELYDPRMLILTDEMIKRARHLLKEIDVSKEALDTSIIDDVSRSNGLYLSHSHTAKNFKNALWLPPGYIERGNVVKQTEPDKLPGLLTEEITKLCEHKSPLPADIVEQIHQYLKSFIMPKNIKQELLGRLQSEILYSDGAMGTMLQKLGFKGGCADELNLKNPEMIKSIHKAYADAGANIILTNTFGANRVKLSHYNLQNKLKEINEAGVKIAREAAPNCTIAGDIAPLGKYIEPLDNLTFDEAYEAYKEQVEALKDADVLLIETISDIKILKAAMIAAKESGKLIMTSMTFEGLRTATGTDVKTYTKIADSLGADVIGVNCSVGPEKMYEVAKIITKNTNKPIIIQPNAGLPKLVDGKTVFDATPESFSDYGEKFVNLGANILGGCCGTTPDFIKALIEKTKNLKPVERNNKIKPCLCSRTRTIEIDDKNLIVGDSLNASENKDLQEEIKAGKTTIIRKEALQQKNNGAYLLNINVGVPGTDEISNLKKVIEIVQNTVDLPLVIETSNKEALEEALKHSDGKPLIKINNDSYSLDTFLPLTKKYGASIIDSLENALKVKISKSYIKRGVEIYGKSGIEERLFEQVLYGDRENILEIIEEALKEKEALEINDILIDAMEEVGKRFNSNTFFLPQVLQSAAVMKLAFERLKKELKKSDKKEKAKIIFATVENDVHDIGKNIVIAMLESSGYSIIDLGSDVPLNKIIDRSVKENADLIALSALMTTTAPGMEKIVKELKKQDLKIPVIIGGAVITQDYADSIDAAYSPDAINAVKVIKRILNSKDKI